MDRNFKGVQFEETRTKIDHRYNQVHDALSEAYYNKMPFVWRGTDYGILDKATFDELHGLIFEKHAIELHSELDSLPPERKPRADIMEDRKRLSLKAEGKVKLAKDKGLDVEI